jgi:hypothetical protein
MVLVALKSRVPHWSEFQVRVQKNPLICYHTKVQVKAWPSLQMISYGPLYKGGAEIRGFSRPA